MHNRKCYSGMIFEVWEREQSWFWFIIDPAVDGGAIGVASSENEAVRDACASIDGMTARIEAPAMTAGCWEISLANLELYLSCIRDAAA